jgi:hypothetical protein
VGYVSVSLVCTVHEEKGLANVSNLCVILERIRPEVIFLEIPPAAFDDYVKTYSRQNLESNAARRYRESHQVELIPVDLPTPGEDFFKNNQYLFERIEETSREYRRLIDLHSTYVGQYGFAYLNSEHCSNLWSDVYKEMLSTIGRIGDSRLVELHELWNKTHDLRDWGMLKNIRNYCGENTFDRGVFLVGASHRQSLIDKSRDQSGLDSRVRWDF